MFEKTHREEERRSRGALKVLVQVQKNMMKRNSVLVKII